jgi:hypothetical protein
MDCVPNYYKNWTVFWYTEHADCLIKMQCLSSVLCGVTASGLLSSKVCWIWFRRDWHLVEGTRILWPRLPVLSPQPIFGLACEQSTKFKDNLELDLTKLGQWTRKTVQCSYYVNYLLNDDLTIWKNVVEISLIEKWHRRTPKNLRARQEVESLRLPFEI